MAKVIAGVGLIVMGAFAILAGVLTLNPGFIVAAISLIGMGSTILSGGFNHAQTVTSQLMIRQPISFRRVIYGKVRASGTVTYVGLSGSKNEYMHIVLTLAGHQLSSIGQMYFDGNLSQYHIGDPTGLIPYPYYDLEIDLGNPASASQPFPHLASAIPAWNSNCLQRGCAKVHITLKYNTKAYPNGVPSSIAFDVQGKAVYDPRTSTTGFSNNPALCIRDFLADAKFGMGAAALTIDDSYAIAAANICDESVSIIAGNVATIGTCTQVVVLSGICYVSASNNLKVGEDVTFSGFTYASFLNGLTAMVLSVSAASFPGHGTGGYAAGAGFAISLVYADFGHVDSGSATASNTQKRYTCDGVFDAGQPRGNVLASMSSAMAGYVVPPGDAWRIYAGAYVTPVLILGQDDLRGPIKMDTLVSRRDLANAIQGTYTSPANNWQTSNYPPYVDDTAVVLDGGTRIWQALDLPFTTDGIRTQRIAKIFLERIRRQKTLLLPCKLSAFPLQPGDTVMFTFAPFGFDEKIFEVLQTMIVMDSSSQTREQITGIGQDSDLAGGAGRPTVPTLGVDLTLREVDSGVYSWNPATDESTWTNPTQTTLPQLTAVAPVTDLGALSGSTTAIVRADGLISDRILVTWTAPADEYVLTGGHIQIWLEETTGGAWRLVGNADGSDTQFYITGVVDGVHYDVKAIAINAAGVAAVPVEVDGLLVSGGKTNFVGTIDPSLPGGILPKGTIPPTLSGAFTYENYPTSIVWSWTGLLILRMDGTETSIPDDSLTITGLTASTTYYFYPFYDDQAGAMAWISVVSSHAHGSPQIAWDEKTDWLSMEQNLQNRVALSAGAMAAITDVVSGGGGGGGSGGGTGVCLRGDMLVETRERGVVAIALVRIGDHLACPEGWTEVTAKTFRPHGIFVRIVTGQSGELIVTPTHPLTLADGADRRAQDLTLLDQLEVRGGIDGVESISLVRQVAEKVLLTCEPHHRFFAGKDAPTIVAHNMRPMPC